MGVDSFLSKGEIGFIKSAETSKMLPDFDSFKAPFNSMANSVVDG